MIKCIASANLLSATLFVLLCYAEKNLSSLPTAIDEIFGNEYKACGKHLIKIIKL